MQQIVYILGHRNPDTDSIASALAYAQLKNELGIPAVPCRLGPLNEETKFATRYFSIDAPVLVKDARCKIRDIFLQEAICLPKDASCNEAYSSICQNGAHTVCITEEDNTILGVITTSDLAGIHLLSQKERGELLMQSSLSLFAKDLQGEILKDAGPLKGGLISIYQKDEDIKDHIVLLDQEDKLQECISKHPSLIIFCGKLEKKDCPVSLIVTEKKTVEAVMILEGSIPLGNVMKQDILFFNENEYLEEISSKLFHTRYRYYPVVDDDGKVSGLLSRDHFYHHEKKKFILLDHSSYRQSIDHIQAAEILEVIDHHNIGDISTSIPILYRNEVCGSTCSIIYRLYQENRVRIRKDIAGMMLSAIISDTLNFHSATCKQEDIKIAKELAVIAEVDLKEYAGALMSASVDLGHADFADLMERDLKTYQFSRFKVAIGQTNYDNYQKLQLLVPDFKKKMEDMVSQKDTDLLIMMFTAVDASGTLFLYQGNCSKVMEEILTTIFDAHSGFDPNILSRKQQLIPVLSSLLERY